MKEKRIFGEDQAQGLRNLYCVKPGIIVAVRTIPPTDGSSSIISTLVKKLNSSGVSSKFVKNTGPEVIRNARQDDAVVLIDTQLAHPLAAHDMTIVLVDGSSKQGIIQGSNAIQKLAALGHETGVILIQSTEPVAAKFRGAIDSFINMTMSSNIRWLGHIPIYSSAGEAQGRLVLRAYDSCTKRLAEHVESIRSA